MIAQAKTRLRVGYLDTIAVDSQLWTGMDRGFFDKQGLDLELRPFDTGLELFQAMSGGDLDVLTAGGAISNFPARGQGKVFLINDIEVATAQLWVRLLKQMKNKNMSSMTPRMNEKDGVMEVPLLNLNSSYIKAAQAANALPKGGDRGPWVPRSSYLKDIWHAKFGDINTGLQFNRIST